MGITYDTFIFDKKTKLDVLLLHAFFLRILLYYHSFIMETANGNQSIHVVRNAKLAEGKLLEISQRLPTRSLEQILVKMEILEPMLLK